DGGDRIVSVAFSADGERLTSISSAKIVKVWELATGKELPTPKGYRKHHGVHGIALSPNGKRIAGMTNPYMSPASVIVWDLDSGQKILELKGHTGSIYNVAYSPDGKLIASASQDKTARVWDAESGAELLTLAGHTEVVRNVAF